MKLLITGHKGLIGRSLYDFFQNEPDYSVKGVDLCDGLDLNDFNQVEDFFKSIKDEFKIDYVLIAHGLNHHIDNNHLNNPISEGTSSIIDSLDHKYINNYFESNVLSVNNIFRACTTHHGSVKGFCTLASMYSNRQPFHKFYSVPKSLGYVISKHALVGLNNYYSTLLGPKNIRFNLISPGCIEANQSPEFKTLLKHRIPLDRLSYPSDLFGICKLLCSDDSCYITGANIDLDGGTNLF